MSQFSLVTMAVAQRLKELNAGGGDLAMSRDNIAQTYTGKWGDAATVQKARQRIHWITSQVTGTSVLDVGTSEGVVPILLGREGFRVVGIDINAEAIAFANEMLGGESEAIRERVEFRNVSLFQDGSELTFDTVIAGEVLQHVSNAPNFLKMAVSHLNEGGRLILTTPFGVVPDRDHKHTFYLSDLYKMLTPHGALAELSVIDGYICAVLDRVSEGTESAGLSPDVLLTATEQAAFEAQTTLWQQLDQIQMQRDSAQIECANLKTEYRTANEYAAAQQAIAELEGQMTALNDRLGEEQAGQARATAERDRLAGEYAVAQQAIAELEELLTAPDNTLTEAQVALDRITGEYGEAQQTIAVLEDRLTALGDSLDEAQTRYEVLQEAIAALEADNQLLSEQLMEAERDRIARTRARDGLAPEVAPTAPPEATQPAPSAPQLPLVDMIRALNVPTQDLARHWLPLARDARHSDQGLALKRLLHEVVGTAQTAKVLGFGCLEAGEVAEAAGLLEDLPQGAALSSREERLLKLLRAGDPDSAVPLPPTAMNVTRSRLRVAVIMDEFTYNCYGPEGDLLQLSVDNWEQELENFGPEMLMIESAWRGKDDKWGAKVGHLSAEVQGILAWCNKHGVPTAFWNKEDPIHFETFLTTASKFDAVFTTDIDKVADYKAALGHDNAFFLPFGCQTDIHNPLEIYDRKDAFCFAGAYYVRYPHRTKDLEEFVAELPKHRPLEIYDRNFGKGHPDYMFPEAYKPFIVGTLAASEIDKAYKGYRFGINLNSIKDSQTMFARRVYELLASGTITVSNYSRGLRVMFGDLVVSSDSGPEVLKQVRLIDDQMGPRFQLAGIRKALNEHSYTQRMAYVASKLNRSTGHDDGLPAVTVLAKAGTADEAASLIAQFTRQSHKNADMVLVLANSIDARAFGDLPDTILCLSEDRAAAFRLADVAPDGNWVAGFCARDHYLLDLILATRYSAAQVIGKDCHYRLDEMISRIGDLCYRPVSQLALRRAIAQGHLLAGASLTDWLEALPDTALSAGSDGTAQFLATDAFNYCEDALRDGATPQIVAETVDDLPGLDCGLPLQDLLTYAENTLPSVLPDQTDPTISGAKLAATMPPVRDGSVTWTCEGDQWEVTSKLADSKHVYIYQSNLHKPADVISANGQLKLHLEASAGLNLYWVIFFLDAKKQKIEHKLITANRNHALDLPEGTTWLRFGLRVYSGGFGSIRKLVLGEQRSAPLDVMGASPYLVLTNHYPSYNDLYRNGFVHSRVSSYQEAGTRVDVFRMRPDEALTYHEFANVDCMTGSAEQLDHMLASGRYKHVLVHFLDPVMWEVLQKHLDQVKVTIWLHGSEVQPWWRRAYNYTTDAEIAAAKIDSAARVEFWQSVLTPFHKNLYLVFVSQYSASTVMEDIGMTIPQDKHSIIHNPINDAVFDYHDKTSDMRRKILSIRPFSTATYANDLSVKAIQMLQDEPFFKELEFKIIGNGALFDEITKPVRYTPNVILERRFLTQPEIAEIHKEYGVFLCPSRMDSQGVSRDEAMSSGLVPVTSAVAAIPEFVDEASGYLAPLDDAQGLADAIRDMYHNPETFLRKSKAAAARVRGQSGRDIIITRELAIITDI